MNNIREYAPYVYLNKSSKDKYTLFITIMYYQGQRVEWVGGDERVFYQNGTASLNYTISGEMPENKNTRLLPFSTYEVIQPLSSPYGDKFDLQTFGIEVNVMCDLPNLNGDKRTIKVYYEDADEEGVIVVENKVLNSPYLYLNNPSAQVDGVNLYKPYCLLFVKDLMVGPVYGKQEEDGVYEQSLELVEDPNSDQRNIVMVKPDIIPSNSSRYTDLNEISGYFETEIVQGYSRYRNDKRKGKLRNISADEDPSDFVE